MCVRVCVRACVCRYACICSSEHEYVYVRDSECRVQSAGWSGLKFELKRELTAGVAELALQSLRFVRSQQLVEGHSGLQPRQ